MTEDYRIGKNVKFKFDTDINQLWQGLKVVIKEIKGTLYYVEPLEFPPDNRSARTWKGDWLQIRYFENVILHNRNGANK